MRTALILVLGAAAGACAAEEDEGPFRPGGGGGGGGGGVRFDAGVDGAGDDAGDGGATLSGLICVVTDLRMPDACPSVAARADVPVTLIGSASSTTSGSDGRYTLPIVSTQVTIVAATGSTTLVRSYVPATVGGAVIETPVISQAAYDAVIDSLGTVVPDGGGAVVAYITDGNSPALNVAFSTIAGSSVAPFYDNGGPTAWIQGSGTAEAGVALFVDVPAGDVSLDGVAPDSRVARATVPVAENTLTFVTIALAPP